MYRKCFVTKIPVITNAATIIAIITLGFAIVDITLPVNAANPVGFGAVGAGDVTFGAAAVVVVFGACAGAGVGATGAGAV